jgi:tetratricopeptide (TPR) repeat protein
MRIRFFPRCLIGLLLWASVFGQMKPPGGGNSGAGTRTPTDTNGQPPLNQTNPDFSQHPLFLAGKVTMEDGTSPPESLAIQLICHASPRSIGRTDGKGNFNIDLNNRAAMMTFADSSEDTMPSSTGGPMGSQNRGFSNTVASASGVAPSQTITDRDLMGCDLQATLPGFRSDVLHLTNRKSLDDPNVGTLIMHRLANVEGTTISITSAMAPKDARKAMERAQNFAKKEKWDQAQKEIQKAVEIYPKYAVAWSALGGLQERANDSEGARKSFAMALEADPKLIPPYLALASMASRNGKWQEVCDDTERILKLNPVDFPQAYSLNAMSNYYLNKFDVAEKSARDGIEHDPEHRFPRLHELLGAVLIRKHDSAGAAEQFRKYLRYAPEGPETARAQKQLADLERSLSPEATKQ